MNPTDDQVRALLEEAVADVHPRPGLDRIRSRTTATRPRARRWTVAAAAIATAAAVLGVVALGPGLPVGSGLGEDPGVATGPAGSDGGAATGPQVQVYFVGVTGPGLRLFAEEHGAGTAAGALDSAMSVAVRGLVTDRDYHTLWPAGTTMHRARLDDGVLSVDLSGPVQERPQGMSQSDAALALQQLVYTAHGVTGTRIPVTFLLDGSPTDTLLGEPTDRPVAAAPADDTLSPVSITSQADGDTVDSPFTVRGSASAFEANVQWELVGDTGNVVKRGFATARECCTLSPYSFTVTAPPGSYTLVVHDEDVSDGEGYAPTQDTKRLTVS